MDSENMTNQPKDGGPAFPHVSTDDEGAAMTRKRLIAATSHAAYCMWHDVLIHPVCGLLWSLRLIVPGLGRMGDRLHYWSTNWPWRWPDER